MALKPSISALVDHFFAFATFNLPTYNFLNETIFTKLGIRIYAVCLIHIWATKSDLISSRNKQQWCKVPHQWWILPAIRAIGRKVDRLLSLVRVVIPSPKNILNKIFLVLKPKVIILVLSKRGTGRSWSFRAWRRWFWWWFRFRFRFGLCRWRRWRDWLILWAWRLYLLWLCQRRLQIKRREILVSFLCF